MPKIIENLREKLSQEARALAMENGYESLNIRAVAQRCGVSVGTVYSYYASKDELAASFMVEDWFECLSELSRVSAQAESAREMVFAIYGQLSGFLKKYRALFKNATSLTFSAYRKYHLLLRSQLSLLLEAFCPDVFTADFIAEALLAWTQEDVPFPTLMNKIEGILCLQGDVSHVQFSESARS